MTKIKPQNDRILVRPLEEHEKGTANESGIIIPDTVDDNEPNQGIVVSVGPGKLLPDGKRSPIELKEGERILFAPFGFDKVAVGGKRYFVVPEAIVLAVIED